MSVSAMAIRELTESTGWVHNADLLGDLPNLDIGVDEVLSALGEARNGH